ncbi:hypothetical protein PILCRDRAFT_469504 [Piloderma croceum F 1598]|uniref:Uncharacterized protein n=1 Tax=Piloderma croceum (strain F 1598) TaxID=765440 RepID=A0A0C3BZ66_PILCF|nr:hypothetical protein PILCRDRAFT_469504 [Piloderma croceum F 1598]
MYTLYTTEQPTGHSPTAKSRSSRSPRRQWIGAQLLSGARRCPHQFSESNLNLQ